MSDAAELGSDLRILSKNQALAVSYTLCVLVDLTVLNLFDEYWDRVVIESFFISLLVAVVLQVLLRLTVALEHRAAEYFKQRGGKSALAMRILVTWLILFISKFVILWVVDLVFGDSVLFDGVIPFIVVIVAIILTELAISKLYSLLGNEHTTH